MYDYQCEYLYGMIYSNPPTVKAYSTQQSSETWVQLLNAAFLLLSVFWARQAAPKVSMKQRWGILGHNALRMEWLHTHCTFSQQWLIRSNGYPVNVDYVQIWLLVNIHYMYHRCISNMCPMGLHVNFRIVLNCVWLQMRCKQLVRILTQIRSSLLILLSHWN